MAVKTRSPLISTAVAVAIALGLTGCAASTNASVDNAKSGTSNNHHSNSNSAESSAAGFSGADIMFAQMMIPHHQQAVDMGTLAESRAQNQAVKAIAARIKAEQAPEITQMNSWLQRAGASLDMGHDMGMGGMLSTEQMGELSQASGAAFDVLYVTGMIGHHEGAIHMAQMVVDSNNAEAKTLGEAIISSQTKQVAELQEILAKLPK